MPRRTNLPFGAVPRICVKCDQHFRPMTEREWERTRRIHEQSSKKHNPALYQLPPLPKDLAAAM
jgi:hypothetical protein